MTSQSPPIAVVWEHFTLVYNLVQFTMNGASEGRSLATEIENWISEAQAITEQITTWWEGWWPRLHLTISFTTNANGLVILHFSVDILDDFQVEEASYNSPVFDQLSASDRDLWAQQVGQQVSQSGALEGCFRTATDVSIMVISILLSLLPSAFTIGGLIAVAAVLALALVTWEFWLFSLLTGMGAGVISLDFVLGLFAGWLDLFFGITGLVVSIFLKSAIIYFIVTKVYTPFIVSWTNLDTRVLSTQETALGHSVWSTYCVSQTYLLDSCGPI